MNLLVYYEQKNINGDVIFAGSELLTDDDIIYFDVNKVEDLCEDIKIDLCKKIKKDYFRGCNNIVITSVEFVEG